MPVALTAPLLIAFSLLLWKMAAAPRDRAEEAVFDDRPEVDEAEEEEVRGCWGSLVCRFGGVALRGGGPPFSGTSPPA